MNYWDKRYKNGGDSGKGSIGRHRDWKWHVIEKYAGSVNHVADIGCGDLSFWNGRDCLDYIGLDLSKVIYQKNILKRPRWLFFNHNASKYNSEISGDIVFCLDCLFHILDEFEYKQTISNLCKYSSDWIFIFTWRKNPFTTWKYALNYLITKQWKDLFPSLMKRKTTDNHYQKYRDFSDYYEILNFFGFKLKAVETPNFDDIGAMYIFQRTE